MSHPTPLLTITAPWILCLSLATGCGGGESADANATGGGPSETGTLEAGADAGGSTAEGSGGTTSGIGGGTPTGGSSSSTGGGNASGGAQATTGGAASSTGGTSTGGNTSIPDVGPGTCGCAIPSGEWGQVDSTIVVSAGQVYDGECMIYRANPDTLGTGDQSEDQLPLFEVHEGATLRNVVLGASAADGVHLYGNVTLENIHWLDIGEDAMTVKETGTVYLNCGSATNGDDKVFQVNAASEIHISNFTASNAGKFMRQNGGTTFFVDVTIDHCDISAMDEVIFRTDSTTSHVTLTNTLYSDLGDGLFMFGSTVVNGDSSQSTVSNNQEY